MRHQDIKAVQRVRLCTNGGGRSGRLGGRGGGNRGGCGGGGCGERRGFVELGGGGHLGVY